MSRKFVRLDPLRADEAAAMLARAFQNDPLQSYMFPDVERRARLSPAHFAPIVQYGLRAGEVWATEGEIDAVGVWWTPDKCELDLQLLDEVGFMTLPEIVGAAEFERFMQVIEHVDPLRHKHVQEPHWYAMVLGVDAVKQGQGLGGALFDPIFERADASHVPCYLETCQPRNVRFYEKHGFRVVEAGVEPQSGVEYWCFLRDAR
jgi:GNAT superfamily N-acetyltransferase